jgi:co-chaperonin GroES (HSP10)
LTNNEERMNLEPMPGRVIIRPDELPRFTPSGLILPDSARQVKPPTQLGTIVAVPPPGADVWLEPENRLTEGVGVGDRVLFRREGRELDGFPDMLAVGVNNVMCLVDDE